MQPEIEIGPLTLQAFGICFALGFVAAGAIIARRMRELGWPADHAQEMVFAALAGGLVGAKLAYVLETGNWDDLLSGTGLTWYGGALGGAAAVVGWARWRGHAGLTLLDVAAVPLALGYAVGRIGCQVSGDGDYGKPWDGPWAMAYPDGTVPTEVPVHPTPIYEALAMALIAWGLWRARHALRPGLLFAAYLVAAGAERLLVEELRRNDEVLAGLTLPQLQSVVMVLAGAVWLGRAARGTGVLVPEAERRAGEAAARLAVGRPAPSTA